VKISLTPSALNDLEQIKVFYQEEGVPQIGEQYVVKIIEHIETLADHPDIGRIVPEFNSPKIRELIHDVFRIVYVRENNAIHVVRIWRSERLMKPLMSSNDDEN